MLGRAASGGALFSPGAAAHHLQSAGVQERPAAEGFLSPMSPRAHWIGPELCGSSPEGSVMSLTAEFIFFFFRVCLITKKKWGKIGTQKKFDFSRLNSTFWEKDVFSRLMSTF